jgi:hypothetical protein
MLLNELVDVNKARETKGEWSDERFAQGRKELGSGQTTRAFNSRTPGYVDRLMYVKGKQDPYLKFIRMVRKHQDNPYFPHIPNAKLYKTDQTAEDGTPIFRVLMQMEKLIPLKDKRIINIMDKKMRELGVLDKEHLSRAWLKILFKDKYSKLVSSSPDPQFREALKLLKPYIDEFGNDLHHKNIMVRPTSKGLQPVLMDPIVPHYTHPPFDELG